MDKIANTESAISSAASPGAINAGDERASSARKLSIISRGTCNRSVQWLAFGLERSLSAVQANLDTKLHVMKWRLLSAVVLSAAPNCAMWLTGGDVANWWRWTFVDPQPATDCAATLIQNLPNVNG